MKNELRALPIPPIAVNDKKAIEIARIWASHGAQQVSLQSDLWEDPAAWGIMLVDLARHVANCYHQKNGSKYEHILQRIREGFDAEWTVPTDEPSGEIFKK